MSYCIGLEGAERPTQSVVGLDGREKGRTKGRVVLMPPGSTPAMLAMAERIIKTEPIANVGQSNATALIGRARGRFGAGTRDAVAATIQSALCGVAVVISDATGDGVVRITVALESGETMSVGDVRAVVRAARAEAWMATDVLVEAVTLDVLLSRVVAEALVGRMIRRGRGR